jgi:uncharacterized C2H2 Zn-finger protein
MPQPCPYCGQMFEERELGEHVSVVHTSSLDPEIREARAHAEHRCVKCGAHFPSPQALSEHLLTAHRL